MRTYKKVIILICSIIFITLLNLYLFSDLTFFDEFFYNKIICLKSENATNIFKFITFLGGGIFIIFLILFFLFANRKAGLSILFSVFFVTVLNNLIKIIICRPRPVDINLIVETGYSFPSGHSITAISTYGLILYYLYRCKFNKVLKKILLVIVSIIMILIPVSRVYLGVHFFSDIVAGSSLGVIWLLLYTSYIENKRMH